MNLKFKINSRIVIALILTSFIVFSCSSSFVKKSNLLKKKSEIITISNYEKQVLFLPINHVGTSEYYSDISKKIDSLKRLNYITYFENVTTKLKDTAQITVISKKFRKISGNWGAKKGYYDTINNTLIDKIKVDPKYKLINQPKFSELKVDTLTAKNADVTLEMLIEEFENKNGIVKLEKCDILTPLDSVYNCKTLGLKVQNDFRENFILGFRDKKLSEQITQSNSDKILLIYGSGHLDGLLVELKKLDSNWTLNK